MTEKFNLTTDFGCNVFSDDVMRERLPKKTYNALLSTINHGQFLDNELAEVVANAMKDWAMEKGATHYCHWFQPMTGRTAQKHEAFIGTTSDGKTIVQFSGKDLIKGEPDASSFPNGGIRTTFEARGYTVWDCTSPSFVKENVLCIPTAFCSYHGDSLDLKTPLLKSIQAISKQANRVIRHFDDTVERVIPTVGAEQEYFLIDKRLFEQRKDLIFTGRTLFGVNPPKGQELHDHYFATVKPRVLSFMREVNKELWKLGVAVKTEHNEVALCQFELAPLFGTANVSTDQNQLVMDTLKKVAERQGLVCLLHEKPFANMNGSGKHVNWSLATDKGKNLLEPGTNPQDNVVFLLLLAAVIKAVDRYPVLLRLVSSNAGNDLRLGADEAPPAVISIFLGGQLVEVLQKIANGNTCNNNTERSLKLGVATIPNLPHDATDRNRTSPFAFTANKFEFRMVASSLSIAEPCTVLNTIVSEALAETADLLDSSTNIEQTVIEIIRETIKDHGKILFHGDGYSSNWLLEAKTRGLPQLNSFVEAIPELISSKTIRLFKKQDVLSEKELQARHDILLDSYIKQLRIEANTMISMLNRQAIPSVLNYITQLGDSVISLKSTGFVDNFSLQESLIKDICNNLNIVGNSLQQLEQYLGELDSKDLDLYERAFHSKNNITKLMDNIRQSVDKLEKQVSEEKWPWPSYEDILFSL